MSEHDRPLGRNVIVNFIQQCDRLSKIVIQVPVLRIPKDADYSAYGFDRGKHPINVRLKTLVQQIEKTQKEIEFCFQAVTP